jgi:hypothetical protein
MASERVRWPWEGHHFVISNSTQRPTLTQAMYKRLENLGMLGRKDTETSVKARGGGRAARGLLGFGVLHRLCVYLGLGLTYTGAKRTKATRVGLKPNAVELGGERPKGCEQRVAKARRSFRDFSSRQLEQQAVANA